MRCVVGQPFAAGPWIPPDTVSVSTIYIVVSIRERVKHLQPLFCTICPVSSFRAVSQRLEHACAVLSFDVCASAGAGGWCASAHDTLPVPRCARLPVPVGPSMVPRAPAPAPPGAGSRAARQPLRPPPVGRRHGPAAPIGSRSGPERATQAPASRSQRPANGPSCPSASSPRPGSPAQRPRRGESALHGVLPVRLHGRAAPISALQVPAQGYVVVHERRGAARQPLSSPPSAPISASMCLRRRVSAGRRAAVAISAGPPIRPGTPGRPPGPPAQFPPPAAAGGSLCRARASEISEKELGGGGGGGMPGPEKNQEVGNWGEVRQCPHCRACGDDRQMGTQRGEIREWAPARLSGGRSGPRYYPVRSVTVKQT